VDTPIGKNLGEEIGKKERETAKLLIIVLKLDRNWFPN
jgi:hypothetical protein